MSSMANGQNRSLNEDADRIMVTYPVTAGDHVRSELETDSYRGYLRTTKAGTVTVGDQFRRRE